MALTVVEHTPSPHLRTLLADAERLAAACAAVPDDIRGPVAAIRRAESALASLRLDGSPLQTVPDPDLIAQARSTVTAAAAVDPSRSGTWFDAMRTFEGPDPDDPEAVAHDASVHALEFDGVAQAIAADELGRSLLDDPSRALVDLHGLVTRHLVTPDRVGRPRTSEQAVHDASVGRILYFTVDPPQIGGELAALEAWVRDAAGTVPGLIVAGIVHLELLRIHPFDAANGRLARAAARLLLRVHDLDPDGLAAPEPVLDADRLGYHDEVARTLRRRDATVWLERWAEAVTAGLRTSARALGQLEVAVPERSTDFLASRATGDRFTVVEHRDETGLDPDASDADLRDLLDGGAIVRVPGSRGLRYEVVGAGGRPGDHVDGTGADQP